MSGMIQSLAKLGSFLLLNNGRNVPRTVLIKKAEIYGKEFLYISAFCINKPVKEGCPCGLRSATTVRKTPCPLKNT